MINFHFLLGSEIIPEQEVMYVSTFIDYAQFLISKVTHKIDLVPLMFITGVILCVLYYIIKSQNKENI